MIRTTHRSLVTCAAFLAASAFATEAFASVRACCLPSGECVVVGSKDPPIHGEDVCEELGGIVDPQYTRCENVVCSAPCRVTGGGVDCFGGVFVPGDCQGAVGQMKREEGINTSTFGGQIGAHGSDFGEWTHVNHSGPSGKWTFHAGTSSAPEGTFLEVVMCSDEPACDPAKANGFHKQIDASGVGSFKNGSPPFQLIENLCEVTIHIEDLGEPGKGRKGRQPNENGCLEGGHASLLVDDFGDCGCPDYYEIKIYCDVDNAGVVENVMVYEHSGYITAGNLQMHSSLD